MTPEIVHDFLCVLMSSTFPFRSVNVFSGTIDMEEMTEIVTTFYSLEGASKGVAMER